MGAVRDADAAGRHALLSESARRAGLARRTRRPRLPALPARRQHTDLAIRGGFAANNSEALREAALGGAGIALLPDFTAQRDLLAGKLVRVLPAWRSTGAFGANIHAMRPYTPHVPRAVQAWVTYLRACLKGGFAVDAPRG